MAWTTPMTAVSGALMTAAQWNASVRDNLLETAPAKATTSGRIFVSTGANAIAQREIKQDYLSASGTTTSTSFVNLTGGGTGPTVAVTTGVLAIVNVQCQMNNASNGPSSRMSYDITGATTSSATDDRGSLQQSDTAKDARFGTWELQTLTAGSNTFVAKYRVSSSSGTFSARTMIVMAL